MMRALLLTLAALVLGAYVANVAIEKLQSAIVVHTQQVNA